MKRLLYTSYFLNSYLEKVFKKSPLFLKYEKLGFFYGQEDYNGEFPVIEEVNTEDLTSVNVPCVVYNDTFSQGIKGVVMIICKGPFLNKMTKGLSKPFDHPILTTPYVVHTCKSTQCYDEGKDFIKFILSKGYAVYLTSLKKVESDKFIETESQKINILKKEVNDVKPNLIIDEYGKGPVNRYNFIEKMKIKLVPVPSISHIHLLTKKHITEILNPKEDGSDK